MTASLADWATRHADLERGLRIVCRIAPERDPARFAAVFGPFCAALRTHLELEEELLLPAFDHATHGVAPNQLPHVVRADHTRIRALVDAVEIAPSDVRAVIERAERLVVLLQVLDHHDRREVAGMFAALDRTVAPEVRETWLRTFAERERATGDVPDLAPLPAPVAWTEAGASAIDSIAAALAQDGDLTGALAVLPPLPGANGARVGSGLRRRLEACLEAPTLVQRRDALVDALDAVRRWRAVATSL